MSRDLCIYFRKPPEKHRFFRGDQIIRKIIRKILRGKPRVSGVERVFLNLCKGFDLINQDYVINKPFKRLTTDDQVIILGLGKYALKGYEQSNKIIAGIALMTHPSEWPDLCLQYPIKKYLQHSEWANNVYKRYYGDKICDTWFSGIDNNLWKPSGCSKTIDFLIYIKFQWEIEQKKEHLLLPIIQYLKSKKITYQVIVYGFYEPDEYYAKLDKSKNMLFFSEHESQGFACCEAMSMNVPILAWDQKFCLDPNRYQWDDPIIPASSVPFFDEKCGMIFKDIEEFYQKIDLFIQKSNDNEFNSRSYILENLTLEKSAKRMLEIVKEVYQ